MAYHINRLESHWVITINNAVWKNRKVAVNNLTLKTFGIDPTSNQYLDWVREYDANVHQLVEWYVRLTKWTGDRVIQTGTYILTPEGK